MGVPKLWELIGEVEEGCSLADMTQKGTKTVAIDLSGWLYASTQMSRNPHLSNTFRRVKHLLKHGVKPVFVLEGASPAQKSEILLRRSTQKQKQQQQQQTEVASSSGTPDTKARSTFGRPTRECTQLLEYMGIPYIQSVGEAEATCAALNSLGIVDGCISNDGDSFLFGAKVVYRNFNCTVAKKGEYPFNSCRMVDIERKLGLDRERLIVLGLLVGCDYKPAGVAGVGLEKAVDFLKTPTLETDSVLDRVRKWRNNSELGRLSGLLSVPEPKHCSRCFHLGGLGFHKREGCQQCSFRKGCLNNKGKDHRCNCDWHQTKPEWENHKTELKIREAALKDNGFPDEKIIELFMNENHLNAVKNVQLEWRLPEMTQLKEFLLRNLNWQDGLTKELAPLLTAQYMLVSDHPSRHLQPDRLVKQMRQRGVDLVQVRWTYIDGMDGSDIETEELKSTIQKCFPQIIAEYQERIRSEREAKAALRIQSSSRKRKKKASSTSQPKLEQFFKKKKPVTKGRPKDGVSNVAFPRGPTDSASSDSDTGDVNDDVIKAGSSKQYDVISISSNESSSDF